MFYHACIWRLTVLAIVTLAPYWCSYAETRSSFDLVETSQGVEVKLDGTLFTRYWIVSGNKPILWPIVGPTGQRMTREYPMAEAKPYEEQDHGHHRSLWFTHGDVNGISFWEGTNDSTFGVIHHRRFRQVEGGTTGLIVAENTWVTGRIDKNAEPTSGSPPSDDPPLQVDEEQVLCHEVRRIVFSTGDKVRIIDFDVTLTAPNTPLRFGDTKEGTFGLRVPGPMSVDRKLGGRIVNREGETDAQAWGKRSAWVDYHGPAVPHGPVVGIAVLHHPSSFRFPTFWHVRTYGLFAANPFGATSFGHSTGTQEIPGPDGAFKLPPGQSIQHRYRIILHAGDHQAANVEQLFLDYAAAP